MPEFEGVENFPAESDNLPAAPLARWGGFLFASVDPVAAFGEFVAEPSISIELKQYSKARLQATKDYEVNAHWALYCENYLEGFHIPFVHHSLNEVLDYGSYSTETFRYNSMQTGYDKEGRVAAFYLFVFPNLMFNFYPWGVSVNVVRPIDRGRSVVSFLTYVSDESRFDDGAGNDLHRR